MSNATKPAPKAAPAKPAAQQQQQPAAVEVGAGKPKSETPLLDKMLEREVEYIPFEGKEPIKLTPALVIRFLCRPTKKGHVCSVDQATRFIMLCKARRLNPWEGDAYLVGYDTDDGPEFNLVTSHQAYLKRAEVHPAYDGMLSGVIVARKVPAVVIEGNTVEPEKVTLHEIEGDFCNGDDIPVGGWAKVYRRDRHYPMYKRLKLATFNKGFSRWKADPAGMIVKCAEADALRSSFPNTLGGMVLDGERLELDAPRFSNEGAGDRDVERAARQDAAQAAKQAGANPEKLLAQAGRQKLLQQVLDLHERALRLGAVGDEWLSALLGQWGVGKFADLSDGGLDAAANALAERISDHERETPEPPPPADGEAPAGGLFGGGADGSKTEAMRDKR